MAKYVYDLSNRQDISELTDYINLLGGLFANKNFKQYIANKCLNELKDICDYTLVTFDEHSVFDAKVQEYEKSHGKEIGRDYIMIYNDTKLAQDEMWWVSPKTKENYPHGISIAKIIEYGTGIKGTSQTDWQVDVNNHGSSGWFYRNPDNYGSANRAESLVRTTGMEGRFIYQKLANNVEKKFDSWVREYMERLG